MSLRSHSVKSRPNVRTSNHKEGDLLLRGGYSAVVLILTFGILEFRQTVTTGSIC